ncbi:MAG: glycine cleavage system aminomethyltransferase GcvT [Planctomycetota bacterium]
MADLHTSPFHKFHEQHGGKFVDFAGWNMPLHYGSVIAEHEQCRTSGALFDVSHMGRIEVKGRHARKFLETVLTRKVSDMEVKQCRYALVCNEQGGVLDDVLVYRFDNHWLLVVNAANRMKLWAHFHAVADEQDLTVKLDDLTTSTAMIAIQGPKVMEQIGKFSKEIPTLKNYRFTLKNLMILKMTVSRTGYTGEDGVEIMMGANMAGMAVKLLLKDASADDAVIKPAGLGARDSLRLEAGMPLYGHELSEDLDPLSAGLKFAVSLDKHEAVEGQPPVPRFIGQDALEKIATAPPKQLIGLHVDGKRTPRQDADVMKGDASIGIVTSGCASPTLGHPIAMAYVPRDSVDIGETIQVAVGATYADAQVVKLPFYTRGS